MKRTVPTHFLRPREFYRALGGEISLREIYGRLANGDIKSIRVGRSGQWLIPASEIEDWPRRVVGGRK